MRSTKAGRNGLTTGGIAEAPDATMRPADPAGRDGELSRNAVDPAANDASRLEQEQEQPARTAATVEGRAGARPWNDASLQRLCRRLPSR